MTNPAKRASNILHNATVRHQAVAVLPEEVRLPKAGRDRKPRV
jgi:hypothetical protein